MGCISSKRALKDERAIQRDKPSGRLARRLITSSRRDEVVVVDADGGVAPRDVAATARLISKPLRDGGGVGSPPAVGYEGEKKAPVRVEADPQLVARRVSGRQRREAAEHHGVGTEGNSRIVLMPNGVEAECVAAGWPAWLASVAGEALRGWVPRRADSFEKLDKIGQGTYSSVYKARDLETGKTVALKKVRFVNMDPESVRFMAREIHVLRKLDHPNIVKLEGLVTSKMSSGLYLVFEYMEHDLAGLAATPGIKFSEPQVKCYMQQLLNGLDHCHSHGVLHRDIKGSNLLIDNDGILKIADFGLATFFSPEKSQQLTSRVVTLWYRPPELLLGATEYGVAVDLWSAGCILAELLAGKPIMPGRTEVEQLHKIFKLCGSPSEEYWRKSKLPHATIFKPQQPYQRSVRVTFKDFPPSALTLLDVILAVEPEYRGTAASALMSEFFTTKPLACDPSALPKYPPSKEYDAKLREEEARRQRAAALKGHRADSAREDYRDAKVPQVADANGEHERKPAQSKDKSSSDRYNTLEDGGRFLNVPSKATAHDAWREKIKEDDHRTVTGRSLSSSRGMSGREMRTHRTYMPLVGGGEMPQLRGLMPARSSRKLDNQNEGSNQLLWPEHRSKYNQVEATETSDKQEWAYHLLDRPSSSQKKHAKEPTTGHISKKRIHYSGPLVPPGGNMEEMLREHEKQIQHAVRKARAGRPR